MAKLQTVAFQCMWHIGESNESNTAPKCAAWKLERYTTVGTAQ